MRERKKNEETKIFSSIPSVHRVYFLLFCFPCAFALGLFFCCGRQQMAVYKYLQMCENFLWDARFWSDDRFFSLRSTTFGLLAKIFGDSYIINVNLSKTASSIITLFENFIIIAVLFVLFYCNRDFIVSKITHFAFFVTMNEVFFRGWLWWLSTLISIRYFFSLKTTPKFGRD